MAKGKKSKSSGKVSKAERSNVSPKLINAMRASIDGATRMSNIIKAWKAGKNPWLTIENPDKTNTKERMIRVKSNDRFGSPKNKHGKSTENADE